MKEYKPFVEATMNDFQYLFLNLIKWVYHERLIILNALISLFFIKNELPGEKFNSFLNLTMSMAFCYVVLIIVFYLYKYKLSKLEIIFLVARKLVFYYLVSISLLTLVYCYYQRENIHIMIILIQSALVIIDHDHLLIFKAIKKIVRGMWFHLKTRNKKC